MTYIVIVLTRASPTGSRLVRQLLGEGRTPKNMSKHHGMSQFNLPSGKLVHW